MLKLYQFNLLMCISGRGAVSSVHLTATYVQYTHNERNLDIYKPVIKAKNLF